MQDGTLSKSELDRVVTYCTEWQSQLATAHVEEAVRGPSCPLSRRVPDHRIMVVPIAGSRTVCEDHMGRNIDVTRAHRYRSARTGATVRYGRCVWRLALDVSMR